MRLPPLPIDKGFETLKHGIDQGYPSDGWIGALDYFDVGWGRAPEQVQTLIRQTFKNQLFKEAQIIAEWALQYPHLRRPTIVGMCSNWINSVDKNEIMGQWILKNIFKDDPSRFWSFKYRESNYSPRSSQETVGQYLLKSKHENAYNKCEWLLEEISNGGANNLANLNWDGIFEDIRLHTSDVKQVGVVTSQMPDDVLPRISSILLGFNPKKKGNSKVWPHWDVVLSLLYRLEDHIDISQHEKFWEAIVHEGVYNNPILERLIRQMCNADKDPQRLVKLGPASYRKELEGLVEEISLNVNTAPARSENKKAMRL